MKSLVIASDLDGTLLNSQLQISKKNKQVLRQLKSKGAHIVLCTGRPFLGMAHFIPEIGLDKDDYTISYNGSLVQSADCKKILHQAFISANDFKRVTEFFSHYHLGVHAMTLEKIYTYQRFVHPLTVRESYLGNLPLVVLKDSEYVEQPIIKLMAVGEGKKIDQAIPIFNQVFGSCFSINKSEDYYLEIMQKGDNKARALECLLHEMNLDANSLIAFGNNRNDMEMLQFAKIGVAVENAVDELKQISDYVTKSNDNDGVAHFLEHFCA